MKLAASKVDTTELKSFRNLNFLKTVRVDFNMTELEATPDKDSVSHTAESPEDSSSDSDSVSDLLESKKLTRSVIRPDAPIVLGSGLKRPLDIGEDGAPIIKRRRRLNASITQTLVTRESSWDGLSTNSSDDQSEQSGTEYTISNGSQTSDDTEFRVSSAEQVLGDHHALFRESSDGKSTGEALIRKERSSAFKIWAKEQFNEALGFSPTPAKYADVRNIDERPLVARTPRTTEQEPLPAELGTESNYPSRVAFSVQVNRSSEIQDSRFKLPVVAEEQKIMEAIHNNPVVIVCGATGSGKTTQIPQFLYEAGYGSRGGPTPGMIGVTQPRRIAAVSMSKRVGEEMGDHSSQVSYQIRFERTTHERTAIKFMTDGILIREIAKDFALSQYSAIVIDEAHERSSNTDILIGMVSRIVDLRASMAEKDPKVRKLKVIIMSATLRISDFTGNPNLFRGAPPRVLETEGRQHPVTIHFTRTTRLDYVEEAFIKISKGHKRLPPGGMLVFLTGQNEIMALMERLRQNSAHAQMAKSDQRKYRTSASEAPQETEDLTLGADHGELIVGFHDDQTSEDDEDIDSQEFNIGDEAKASPSIVVRPLYSQLPTKEQMKVFEEPPAGFRMIVLATNVAETSLTIPGIRYVFDCGRAKGKKYDTLTGVQSFDVGWISKASASQRAGRAGRTGPGHCYRLYSSAIYEREFPQNAEPEILKTPVESVVLELKSMNIQHVENFPFPTPPSRDSLIQAMKLLKSLGALSMEGKVTQIGHDLSIYPLSPRLGKMLVIGHQYDCMPFTIAMVAALAVPDIFVLENQIGLESATKDSSAPYTNEDRLADTAQESRKRDFNRAHALFSKKDKTSDSLKSLTALCAYSYAADPESFCNEMFLRSKALKEATQLRQQLTDLVRLNQPGLVSPYTSRLPEPTLRQLAALKQIVAAGFIDQIAIRADMSPEPPTASTPRNPKRAIDVPYLTLFPSSVSEGRAENLDDRAVYVHPSSVLAQISCASLPQYIIYSRLQRTAPSTIAGSKTPKVRMHALTTVSGVQIYALARGTPLIEYSKPIGKILPLERGSAGRERRECWVIPNLVGKKGRTGWPLPAQKVVQIRDGKGAWEIERVVAS